ncbi:hypothetical protein KFV05_02445 [Macrococcoides canis]|uniref:hypothetical protein n=1 Tax=Macrococcoides canis TaxID=1855823 RepID=UPI0020B855AD|nr:hypothetical protein [Macrococcus canis]UTH02868.1 hypothetical protein KFV05_02445 [Macrococcus canis]
MLFNKRKIDQPKWEYPSAKGLQLESVNNAAIETFKGNPLSSLAREICQNSLDAVEDNTKPVIVSFDAFDINTSTFPEISAYKDVFNNARKTWENKNPQAIEFINNAQNVLNKDEMHILKISDYNTKGLSGADSRDIGTPWSTLVKEKGSSNKSDTSGGSFGIGKAAPFACSDLRTVFYSTCIYETKEKYHIGVSNIMSYEKPDETITQGVGFYSIGDNTESIKGSLSCFKDVDDRTTKGTDIFVAAFNKMKNWEQAIIESIIVNFLVTIWKKKLVVKVGKQTIDAENIKDYINQLPNKDMFNDVRDYYEVLTSEDTEIIKIDKTEYGKDYGYEDGEAVLCLLKKQGANRRILMTRSVGMRLFEQKNISSSIYFTGILMIEGKKMNMDFKKMENPAHDNWSPERYIENPAKAKRMLNELKRFNKNKVIELFREEVTNEMDAIGMSDFLPDTTSNQIGDIKKRESLENKTKEIKVKKHRKPKNSQKTEIESDNENFDDIEIQEVEITGNTTEGGTGGGDNTVTKDGEDGGEGGNPGHGSGSHGYEDDEQGEAMTVPHLHKKNLIYPKLKTICTNQKNGQYTLMIKSTKNIDNPIIEVFIIGEQTDIRAQLIEAKHNGVDTKVTSNRLQAFNIEKNVLNKIEVKINFDKLARIGVKVYASKK